MIEQAKPKKDWPKYIQELFDANPGLRERTGKLNDQLFSFFENHTEKQLEQFVEAWGNYHIPSLKKILNVPDCYLLEFFGTLLNKGYA